MYQHLKKKHPPSPKTAPPPPIKIYPLLPKLKPQSMLKLHKKSIRIFYHRVSPLEKYRQWNKTIPFHFSFLML